MKKYILSCLLVIYISFGFCQDNETRLFSISDHCGGFGGVSFNLFDGVHLGIMGEGAALIRNFYVGGYGYSSEMGNYTSSLTGKSYKLENSEGGLMFGAISNTNALLALFSEVKIGFGKAVARATLSDNVYEEYQKSIYSVSPKIGVSILPVQFIQIRLYAAYRFSSKMDFNNIIIPAQNAYVFGIGLFLGAF